jgi:hypothetical protein
VKVPEQVELKHLQTQISESSTALQCLEKERLAICEKIQREKGILESLKSKIKQFQGGSGIVVSEHAILRFIERVYGLNMEEAKALILPKEIVPLIEKLGRNGDFPVNDTHRVRVKNGIVVTILAKDEPR